MPAPHAVLLTLSDEGKRPVWSYRYTGTLPRLISFVSHSYENTGGVGVFFPFRLSLSSAQGFILPVPIDLSRSYREDPDPVGATAHSSLKSFSCNTYEAPRKCCKQKTYVIAKPFRCNTYKKPGGTPLKPNTLLPHASDSCPLALLSPLLSLQCFFYRRCNDFADAFAQRWHVFLRQTLGLDDVMQINRNFRRPQHPVARPVVLERPHQAHRHDGNPELLRHPEAAVLALIHVP